MGVLDERYAELVKLVEYAEREQAITQLGVDYRRAALDMGIAIRQMMVEILKYKLPPKPEKES